MTARSRRLTARRATSVRRVIEVVAGLALYAGSVALHLRLEATGEALEWLPVEVIGALVLGFAVGRWWAVAATLAAFPFLAAEGDLEGSGSRVALGVLLPTLLVHLIPAALGVTLRRELT